MGNILQPVIFDGVRTPIGRLNGSLASYMPEDLIANLLGYIIEKNCIDSNKLSEIIIGHAKQSSDQPNIARLASLIAKVPIEVPAYTVHRQCASGMTAVHNAAQAILSGLGTLYLAGGVESMSNAAYYLRNARRGYMVGNGVLLDPNTESQPCSQPQEEYGTFTMGETAENIAECYNISREDQDYFAYKSQQKAFKAITDNIFDEEIMKVDISTKKEKKIFSKDEHPRQTSLEKLASLKPVFRKNGTVTAGNSSGRNDGAAVLLVGEEANAKLLELKPVARIISQAVAGIDPRYMGLGPVPATKLALERANLTIKDIGLVELNEAFAAQSLACIRLLDIPEEIVNVNGGAIALGHPIGCSGARILVTLLHEMRRRKVKYGLATLCVAGGLGCSTILELCE